LLNVLKKINDTLYSISKIFITVSLAIIVILVFSQVFSRYVFHFGISWSQEITTYILIWMLFIGCSMGLRDGEIISLEILKNKLSKKNALYLSIFIDILLTIFFLVGIIANNKIIERSSKQLSPILNIPMSWIAGALTVSFIMMILYSLNHIIEVSKATRE